MIKHLPIILALLFLTFDPALAEPVKSMGITLAEKRQTKFTILKWDEKMERSGFKRGWIPSSQETMIEKISLDGKEYYQVKEKTELNNGQRLENTTLIENGEYLKPVSFASIKRNPAGEEIYNTGIRFDDPTWDLPDDTYPISMLSLIFRSLIDQNLKETDFHLWISEYTAWRIMIKIVGKENVRVPLGDFRCYKIEMITDVRDIFPFSELLAIILQPFVPKQYFWLGKEEPYPTVKFEGTLGPTGSIKAISELVGYEDFLERDKIVDSNRNDKDEKIP